jgi:SPP1 family predicted phage head-tail adaptor
MFKPNVQAYTTPIRLQHRVDSKVNGAMKATYQDADPAVHFCQFKPFHGVEAVSAGQLGIIDGGTITLWYTPGVSVKDRVLLFSDPGLAYEITSVEDIELRGITLVLKVKRLVTP